MATSSGPLMGEPLEGVACIVESIKSGESGSVVSGGRVITAVKETIHQCMLDASPRIKLAMYLCDIQATAEVLGKVYGVVTRRRGRIISEEMREGTPFFWITAEIPVVEAFGFSEEIRKRTSGAANPQLVFRGFKTLDIDPFWVPTTDEELEELGDTADKENVALLYIEKVRRRKGLRVDRKLVDKAEKQRTLKRN